METAGLDIHHRLILIIYFLSIGGLGLFALHRLRLLCRYFRAGPPADPLPQESAASDAFLPSVLVQIPVYNEPLVVGRVIAAAAALENPGGRTRIQVLDDSDDETTDLAARAVAIARESGVNIEHVRRSERTGYKAGALAAGLRGADEELVAIFDADFIPPPDFVTRILPSFRDPGVGFVQARWDYLNADDSVLTRVQALLLDGHFMIEQGARCRSGWMFNFNGTAGVWRRRAIEEAGGWTADTLTEDLDLSYRAGLAGWKSVFRADIAVPSELPSGLRAFSSQQRRWAAGSIQCARKLAGPVLRPRLAPAARAEALLHLTSNFCFPLILTLCAVLLPVIRIRTPTDAAPAYRADLLILAFGAAVLAMFYANARRELGGSPLRTLVLLPPLMALGAGISVSNSIAVLRGLLTDGGEFVRTPKLGRRSRQAAATRQDSAPLLLSATGSRGRFERVIVACIEAAVFGVLVAASVECVRAGRWAELPFPVLFATGFGWVLAGSARDGRPVRLRSGRSRAQPPSELKVENFSPRHLNAG